MLTIRATARIAAIVSASVIGATSGLSRAAPPAQPNEHALGSVSGTLAEMARQQADKGRAYEAQGQYPAALQQYREAIAGLDKYFDGPSNHANGNPLAFLVRAGAAVDAARALSRSSATPDTAAIKALTDRAESDFTTVIRIVTPVDGKQPLDDASRAMLMKATLGRGYARLLAGDLVAARTDLRGLKVSQAAQVRQAGQVPAGQQQVQGALTKLDHDIAADVKAPPDDKKKKVAALMNLGQEVVKAFFPRYQGLAVAVGGVADAFQL